MIFCQFFLPGKQKRATVREHSLILHGIWGMEVNADERDAIFKYRRK